MGLPFIELQTALYQRLENDPTLMELGASVYSYVTEDTPSPYIVFGEPILDLAGQVKVEGVLDEMITLHVWHNQAETGEYGNAVPYKIISAVYDALKVRLDLPSYDILQVSPRDPRILDDIDNITKHGVIMLTYKLKPKGVIL